MKIPKLLSPASAAPAGSAGSARSSSERGRYSLDSLLDALAVAYIRAPRWGWLAPALIVLVAGILRFYNLAHPNAIVFGLSLSFIFEFTFLSRPDIPWHFES